MIKKKILPSSYKDPSGFVFKQEGSYFRQINFSYKENYDFLLKSGLYKKLTEEKLLIPHKEVKMVGEKGYYKIIRPETIPFVSYPYEWCFSAYKEAALKTLEIQKIAMDYGMSLKDASSYNMAFYKGGFVLLDTLSFEKADFKKPWIAYRQYLQHFLSPLLLMSKKDERLVVLMRYFVNGIPLDLTDKLLPTFSKTNISLIGHLKSYKFSNKTYTERGIKIGNFGERQFRAIIENLYGLVASLAIPDKKSEWSDYYRETNYSKKSSDYKLNFVNREIKRLNPQTIWDFGANSGNYSSDGTGNISNIMQFDNDIQAVEKAFNEAKKKNLSNTQALYMDLFNPSPPLGWMSRERMSLIERGPADLVLALALIHHLAVGNNINFFQMADFFSKTGKNLIIEFIPKDDSNFQKIMGVREDVFKNYTQDNFEAAFLKYYHLVEKSKITGSKRWLYVYKRKNI